MLEKLTILGVKYGVIGVFIRARLVVTHVSNVLDMLVSVCVHARVCVRVILPVANGIYGVEQAEKGLNASA